MNFNRCYGEANPSARVKSGVWWTFKMGKWALSRFRLKHFAEIDRTLTPSPSCFLLSMLFLGSKTFKLSFLPQSFRYYSRVHCPDMVLELRLPTKVRNLLRFHVSISEPEFLKATFVAFCHELKWKRDIKDPLSLPASFDLVPEKRQHWGGSRLDPKIDARAVFYFGKGEIKINIFRRNFERSDRLLSLDINGKSRLEKKYFQAQNF